jgi:hypothetical protein
MSHVRAQSKRDFFQFNAPSAKTRETPKARYKSASLAGVINQLCNEPWKGHFIIGHQEFVSAPRLTSRSYSLPCCK